MSVKIISGIVSVINSFARANPYTASFVWLGTLLDDKSDMLCEHKFSLQKAKQRKGKKCKG